MGSSCLLRRSWTQASRILARVTRVEAWGGGGGRCMEFNHIPAQLSLLPNTHRNFVDPRPPCGTDLPLGPSHSSRCLYGSLTTLHNLHRSQTGVCFSDI